MGFLVFQMHLWDTYLSISLHRIQIRAGDEEVEEGIARERETASFGIETKEQAKNSRSHLSECSTWELFSLFS